MDYRELFKKYLNFLIASGEDDILPSDFFGEDMDNEFTDSEIASLRIIEEELDK